MYLFVYGTLKSPFINYVRYLGLAVQNGKAQCLGDAITMNVYPLVLRPPNRQPATRGPMLLNKHNSNPLSWCNIKGQLYDIDELTFQAMDILEGVDSGYYYREVIEVRLQNEEMSEVSCQCYFYTVQPDDLDLLNAGPLIPFYDEIAHSEYVPGPINHEIIRFLENG